MEQSIYLTCKEVAEIYKISLPTLHSYTKKGVVTAFKLGTRVRYKKESLDKALKAIHPKPSDNG